MTKIYSVALNLHDHNTYDGVFHNQRERHTRFKHNLPYHAEAYNHQSDILNPGDYRLNDEFYKITGIPMLLNTSFNCQEPIVETPEQAIRTFKRTELDILVIGERILKK
jgi:hypothetical protein